MKKTNILIVMDGIGISGDTFGNAVTAANTPTLDMLTEKYPNTVLKAHGTAVGLPSDDDMGNSEVGHNAIGCGQIYSQGAKLVNESIESGLMFGSETWTELIGNCKANGSTLHFIGLLSDGNVHSHINHLFAMLRQAKEAGTAKARVHILLDGRDVPATSALEYVEKLEAVLSELNCESFDAQIASGGGRMKITMDRYEADWAMVEKGWKTHVLGEGRQFLCAKDAIETYRAETGVIDQDLPSFVIAQDGEPVGKIIDNDSVILFNFRGDRAIELSKAFDYKDFDKFDRGYYPKVCYAGMLQYDGDLKLPASFLVNPPKIEHTLSEYLVKNNIKQYAVSETQKFGHVTYFWNGNKTGKFSEEAEDYCEIRSDKVSFDERPWMKAAEVTDKVIEAIASENYGFIRANFPNGDMVGHTGNYDAAVIAVETVDLCLARILKAADEHNASVIITADHGNADEMYEKSKTGEKKAKTSHTLNPVPFIIYDKNKTDCKIKQGSFGLSNIAATVAGILGLPKPDVWDESITE